MTCHDRFNDDDELDRCISRSPLQHAGATCELQLIEQIERQNPGQVVDAPIDL